jgi:hypothetical protein
MFDENRRQYQQYFRSYVEYFEAALSAIMGSKAPKNNTIGGKSCMKRFIEPAGRSKGRMKQVSSKTL